MNNKSIVFPGQGSQAVGMLGDMAVQFSKIQKTFERASAVLGYDLWSLTQQGPAEALGKTVHAQPALLTAGYAIWQLIAPKVSPRVLAGHSLGEYTALLCAESIVFEDAVRLVAARGQYMQEAVAAGTGGMAAIVGLDTDLVEKICREAITSQDEIVSPANFNSIGQIVIAGHLPAVERAVLLAKEKGAKLAKLIPVSVPSHCALMQSASEQLGQLLASINIKTPILPVFSNADAILYTTPETIRDGLIKQLCKPVRWVEIIQSIGKMGIEEIIECGPGKVLSGLNKRIVDGIKISNTADLLSLQEVMR